MRCIRRFSTLALLVGLMLPAWAAGSIDLAAPEDAVRLLSSSDEGLSVLYRFSRIESFDVQTERGLFSHISMPGLSYSTRLGEPKLPVSYRIISVPLGAEVSAEAVDYNTQEIELSEHGVEHPLMPAQPSLSKSQSPEDVPFVYDAAAYAVTGYGDIPLVHVEELGILRGMRLFALVVEPVRYDPARHMLAVYNELEIEVEFRGGDPAATSELRSSTWSPYFESIYQHFVLNYEPAPVLDDITRYPVKYIIISDPMFEAQLQPFIAWNTQRGFEMFVGYVGDPEVGTTTTSIKNYIQGIYDAEEPKPSFVLFVGDVGEVPVWNGNTGSHITDLHYVRLEGTDYMPEMYYGRFSARDPSELQPQIDKTLEYERYEMPDARFLGEVVMIAGYDATHGSTWGNGQINYGTTYYFNAAHGIYSYTYLFPESQNHSDDIIQNVSEGVGYANYTAHGGSGGWSNPSFTISDIEGLQNAHMYPTVVGNCCLTNKFEVGNCFGEAWLRAEDKGAIGYIGGTNSTYWDEDYWWGVGSGPIVSNPTYEGSGPGAYDGMFHDHGEPFPEWYMTQYAFIMAGNLAVVDGGSGMINYYWEIYALMGDPALTTYFGVPSENVVDYPEQIFMGLGSVTIIAEAWSYVGLSRDGQLYAAGLVDETGEITLEFEPFTSPGDADLVITRQNRQPVITTIPVIPNEGPYLITAAEEISDVAGGNGNGLADFGETLDITLTEENIGNADAINVVVDIATEDAYLTITDDSEDYGTIEAGQQVTIPNGFEAVVAANVPDGHFIRVNVTATGDARDEWYDWFNIMAHAPMISITSALVDDASGNGNGVMDAGETVELTLTLYNSGSASATTLVGTLTTDHDDINITQGTGTLALLDPENSGSLTPFTVEVLPSAPPMDRAYFYLELAMDGGRTEYMILELTIGGFFDTIENGQGGWTHQANQAGWNDQWHISTEDYYSPTHAWKCGDTGAGDYASHMDAVLVTPTINLTGRAELQFWHWMAAEVSIYYPDSAYDGGIVEIFDGGEWTQLPCVQYNKHFRHQSGGGSPATHPFPGGIPCFSGDISWSQATIDLSAYSGDVQIRFHFGSDNGTGDEGWYVDDVRMVLAAGNNPPENLQAQLIGSTAHLSWESPSSDAVASILLGYNIYRDGGKIDSLVQALTYEDDMSQLPYGTYTYEVSAQYSDAESGMSNPALIEWGELPDPVTDLTVQRSGDDITLNWTLTDADEYHIYSSDDPETFEGIPVVVAAPPYILTGDAASFEKRFYRVHSVRH